jgi:ABC-2 type transport system permease protein
MFRTVFEFELAYWFKRPLTLLFFTLFFLMAFFSTASEAFLAVASGQIHRNAPFVLAAGMGILTAIGQVITTAVAGTAVLRDAQLGTEEMLFTTRLSKSGYLLGRFAASFVVMVVIYVALPSGLLIGTLMPWVPADKLGPVSVWAAFQPFFTIAIPNLFFASALLFAIGAFTRKLFAVYVTGIMLLLAWQITQQIIGHLDKLTLASLIDPFALTTMNTAIRYWSVAEKNRLLIPFDGLLLQNRLLWIGAALVLFGVVSALFKLRLQHSGKPRRKSAEKERTTAAVKPIPVVALSYDRASWLRTASRESIFYFRSIVREAPFLAITVICAINILVGAWYTAHPSDSAIWPVTSAIAPTVLGGTSIFVILLATLYGGELVWRERQLKLDQVQDSMPVPAWVPFGGKLFGVFLAIVGMLVVSTAAGIVMQLAQAYTRLQPLLYIEIVGVVAIPTALAVVALAMGVHAMVNQKFVGHLIVIAYWVMSSVLSKLVFDHRLYQVGRPPDFVYSDMAGWGPYMTRILTFQAYTVASCLAIAAIGYLVLVRGSESAWRSRRGVAARRWKQGGLATIGAFAIVAIALGGFFFYNANVLNAYTEVHVAEKRVKAWELEYKKFDSLPKPRLVSVSLRHDYFPEQRAAKWDGTLRAVNRNARAVDTLFMTLPATGATPASRFEATAGTGLHIDSLAFDRPATLLRDDLANGVRLYRLATPLAAGETLTVRFAGDFEPRGFPNDAFNNDVSPNGSFMNSQYVPSFGYQEGNELSDDDVRERNGLKPKPRMKAVDDPAVRFNSYISSDADWIAFDETTCTAPDQISIAPGYLGREWTENGRRCFHYAMDKPILDFYSTLSARYAVERTDHNGVKLEIYYHPDHKFALPSMLQASKDGLDYFGKNFSPYLYRQYRIIEFPKYQGFAQAFPNTIPYSEGIGFLYRKEQGDDKVDLAYFVTAHELAHQWWAHQVVGGNGQGSTMFSEGLAEYSALTVLEKRYGAEATQKFLRRELDGYLRGRGTERKKEVPLLYVENQPYIHYQKGSLCFYALRDYIGEDAMNSALRSFLSKWGLKGPPYPTSRDLLAEFDKVTPDSLKYVLKDLFEDMTFYDNKADSAVTTKRPDGTWNVHLVLKAKKMKGDSVGNTRDVPVADYMDVGIFGDHVAGQKLGEPLLVKKLHITQNVTTLDFVVPKEPKRAGIDPYNKLIDRTPEDNAIAVTRR